MPADTDELVELLQLTKVEKLTFKGRHPRTFMQRTYGGQVFAQALMAAYQTVPPDRFVHSMHGYFMRPGQVTSNLFYVVEEAHDGGSFNTRRVRAEQGYREIFSAAASFHQLEPGLSHHDPMPADIKPPEQCPKLVDVMNARFGEMNIWHEWDALDARFVAERSIGPTGTEGANMQLWVKTVGELPDDLRIHQAVLAYLSDLTLLSVSVVPHKVAFLSTKLQTASIDHGIWFHRPMKADQWLLYDMVSPSASYALGFSSGRLFQDGALVASCAQEGLIRQVDNRAVLQ